MKRIVGSAASMLIVCTASLSSAQPEDKKPAPEGQPATANEEQVAKAREYYAQGKEAQDAKDFDLAAEMYRAAFEQYPQPLFLYNIAQVKRLGGKLEEALRHYEEYLGLDADGPGAENAKAIIAEIRLALAEKRPPKDTVVKKKELKKFEPIEPPPPPEIVVPDPKPIEPTKKNESGRTLKIAGLSTAGIGILTIGAGVAFGLRARSKADEISGFEGTWDPAMDSLYEEGESANRTMLITTTIGAAAVLGGGLLYLLGSKRDASGRTESQPIAIEVREDGATFGYATQF